jgi:Zn-dependent peptidase ImmA (M78 family)
MLQVVLDSAGLDAHTCAGLLGISPTVFAEWSAGQRPIPESMLPLLSAVFSVPLSVLRASAKSTKGLKEEDVTPAIWFKFRGPELVDADRECVVLIRQLGHYLNELEAVTRNRSLQWKTLFASIRNSTDLQAAPREQGRSAARMFREGTTLGYGQKGNGEVLRGLLRSLGVLVIETPLKESHLEGCSFSVGTQAASRPCIFANTHHVTWFRRNMVLMHEVGHAIFESTVGATLDFLDRDDTADPSEMRAQAFAQECLVPKSVLVHVAQTNGIKWASLSARALARLVADTHVEQRTIVDAGVDAGLITLETGEELKRADINSDLHELSPHAFSTPEYLELIGSGKANEWLGKRTTTLTSRSLRLPVGYVMLVVDAYRSYQISLGKAAEYLMIDESEFAERFGDVYAGVEE